MQEILEQGKFNLVEENGDVTEYNTLFTFYNEKYNKNYVVYSNDNGIFASVYNPNDVEFDLKNIDDAEELNMVNEQIAQTVFEYSDDGGIIYE